MATLIGSRLTALASLVTLLLTAGHANATPVANVGAQFDASLVSTSATTPLDTGAVGPDANNFARAVANPFAGTVGVAVATDLLGGTVTSLQAGATASLQENWTAVDASSNAHIDCRSIDCSATLNIGLHGVLSSDFGNPSSPSVGGISEEIDVGSFRLLLSNSIDPVTSAPEFRGFYSFAGPDEFFTAPFTVTNLPDGSFLVTGTVPFAVSLFSSFESDIYLSATWDGGDPEGFIAAPLSADLLDTATFNIVSDDPSVVWTSDSGRTSTFAGPPPSGVPEPGTMALMGLGLAGVAFVRKRQSS